MTVSEKVFDYPDGICESLNITLPTYASVESNCENYKILKKDSNIKEVRDGYKDKLEEEFHSYLEDELQDDDHKKISCLFKFMLSIINDSDIQQKKIKEKKLEKEKKTETSEKFLEDAESLLKSNENSELVTKYRNENSEKRNKKVNIYFTLYVTFIVIFLILEGIVFFI